MTDEVKRQSENESQDAIGLDATACGSDASDQSLVKVFEMASSSGNPARFLRLGGPRQFRHDVIGIVTTSDPGEPAITPGYRLILDPRIPAIEFILTDPQSEPFLARMDAEGRENWDIWRIRHQVIEFARGLLRAGELRERRGLSAVQLAFHRSGLVWNLGIADDAYVVARAYHEDATGHDAAVAEIHLRAGSESRLAESLITYYNSVRMDTRTRFVRSEEELQTLGAWPSLYKGNAVLRPSDSDPEGIEKACSSSICHEAEWAWLSTRHDSFSRAYFRRTLVVDSIERPRPWKGRTTQVRRVNGVLGSEFLYHIQRAAERHPSLTPQLESLAGSVAYQAFEALREFREIGRSVPALSRAVRTYPWAEKMAQALAEAGRFITDDLAALSSCVAEASELGTELEETQRYPFRDAHLKNRMIEIDTGLFAQDYDGFRDWVESMSPADAFEWLKGHTHDIDFETAFWLVSEWDDPLHVLWMSGLRRAWVSDPDSVLDLLSMWWLRGESPGDERVLWKTLLCRTLREHCRRVWYDHVMPRTYQLRYSAEPRDLFLDLSCSGAKHIPGLDKIKGFLRLCREKGDNAWRSAVAQDAAESVDAEFPDFLKGLGCPRVFLSYSRRDSDIAARLTSRLQVEGTTVWIDRTGISPGDAFLRRIAEALSDADVMVALISPHSIESKWCREEWGVARTMLVEEGHPLIMPLVISECARPRELYGLSFVKLVEVLRDPAVDPWGEVVDDLRVLAMRRTRKAATD